MRVGIPAEIKNHEYRVAITPAGVHQLVARGHEVLVQAGAGTGSAIADADYAAVGARIVPTAAELWASSELVCKVKEPIAPEYGYLRPDLVLFTYLHLAADRPQTDALLASGVTSIAYETVQLPDGSLPLLAPMSEVAGRLAPQVGAYHLMRSGGGSGRLLGGVPGVAPAKVVVIGGGVAGQHAAEVALGMRADVTVLDLSVPRLRELDVAFGGACARSRPRPSRSRRPSPTRTSWSAPCSSPGRGRRSSSRTTWSPACGRGPCSSTSPWTRAGASPRRGPPRTTTRRSRCTTRCSTASRTCPARCP